MLLPARLVRPPENHDLSLVHFPSASGRAGVRAKRIFVVTQISRLPATNSAAGKKLRRILIFDDHPASLRLVFGRRADLHVHPSDPQGTTASGVALLWILIVGLMIGMFWPVF
jgi:hypothetical protein